MKQIKIVIKGMTCSHCKMNVEKNIGEISGINSVNADVEKEEVIITGDNIDLGKVKFAVESIGYTYEERIN